jgi:hypothetical protein
MWFVRVQTDYKLSRYCELATTWTIEEPGFNSSLVQNLFVSSKASRPTAGDTVALLSDVHGRLLPRGKADATGSQLLTST